MQKWRSHIAMVKSANVSEYFTIANSSSAWHGRADGPAVPEFHVIQVLLCKHPVGRVGFQPQSGHALLDFILLCLCRYVIQNCRGFAHVIFIVHHTVVRVPPAFSSLEAPKEGRALERVLGLALQW